MDGAQQVLFAKAYKTTGTGPAAEIWGLPMDRWGSEYQEDFAIIDRFSLLECSAAIVADQVLWTGASLFLWGLASRANRSLLPEVTERRGPVATDICR